MKTTRVIFVCVLMTTAIAAVSQETVSRLSKLVSPRTKVVLLGTGTPVPDPDRSGPATAIVVDDAA